MGEKTLDAIAGIVFIILILGMEYWALDLFSVTKPYLWMFAILFHAYVFGKNVFPARHWLITYLYGFILLIAVQSLSQVIWFYIGAPLGNLSDAWSLAIAIAMAHLSGVTAETALLISTPPIPQSEPWNSKRKLLAITIGLSALMAFVFVIVSAWNARTFESIRTPWPLLDAGVLPAIALLWMATVTSALTVRSATVTLIHTALAILATLSIAPIMYVLGYGFDGFLHVAGEKVLLNTGTLEPMPYYYMGQYVFSTWIARVFDLPLEYVSRWLIPITATILLPTSLTFAYQRFSPNYYVALIFAMLPLSMFIAPTPQGLATIVGLSAVMLAIGSAEKHIRITGPMWLGLWSIAIHPLAGIPLTLFAMALVIRRSTSLFANIASFIIAGLSGLAVPILFYLASAIVPSLAIQWDFNSAGEVNSWMTTLTGLLPWLGNKFVLWPAWSSLVTAFVPILSLGLALMGFFLPIKVRRRTALFLVASVSLIISAGLLEHASDFTQLISYEKGDYASRLMQLGIMILIIATAPTLSIIMEKIRVGLPITILVTLLFTGAIGVANAHNALPRHDSVEVSRGWSTGKAEIEAVRWIERSAKGQEYTVLANQAVSAAAVKELGFKRYAKDDVFFYPIPTGGPLYEIYLKMTYEDPSIETVREASRLGQTNLVFVVINHYWWEAQKLNEQISKIADEEWEIENGKIMIYKFDFNK